MIELFIDHCRLKTNVVWRSRLSPHLDNETSNFNSPSRSQISEVKHPVIQGWRWGLNNCTYVKQIPILYLTQRPLLFGFSNMEWTTLEIFYACMRELKGMILIKTVCSKFLSGIFPSAQFNHVRFLRGKFYRKTMSLRTVPPVLLQITST